MKKYIIAPICSALVIPGLGQIINQNLKKGLIILSIVFVLLIACFVKLIFISINIVRNPDIRAYNYHSIMDMLKKEDLTVLWIIFILFTIVWVYSVLEAFWVGRKLETRTEES